MYERDFREKQSYPPMGREEIACALAHHLDKQGITYQEIHQELIFRDLTREQSKDNPKLKAYNSRILHEIEDYMMSHDMVKHQTQALDQIMCRALLKHSVQQKRPESCKMKHQIDR